MKNIEFKSKEVLIIMGSLLVLSCGQALHGYNVQKESHNKGVKIENLKQDLSESNSKIKKLDDLLKQSETKFNGKDKEVKELNDQLKKEQDNIKKIKIELDDALARKEQRTDNQYAVNSDTQEVAQSSESVAINNQSQATTPVSSGSGRSMTVEATAYDGYSMGGMTASGVRINSQGDRVIAVDPSVIPLGSRVYVEGYGEAIAADTGGAIKGGIIDLNMSQSEAIAWGRRPVNITILD